MASAFPSPEITLSAIEARRLFLAHHALWPPRSLKSKQDILDYIRRLGCIQYDPINVVGVNPHLVLQSRVAGYRPQVLDELLYQDRALWDGWDKLQSIYCSADFPFFARRRATLHENYWHKHPEAVEAHTVVLNEIRQHGPLSSIDLEHDKVVKGFWGMPMRISRAALENLYNMGEIGIHHRTGTRRYFDLTERLLPAEVVNTADPFKTDEDYLDWHVQRRVSSIGLAFPNITDTWLGILGLKGVQKRQSLLRLCEQGRIKPVAVESAPGKSFFVPADFYSRFDEIATDRGEPQAAFLAPLDNLIWQRDVLKWVFGFEYTWEVYKPVALRQYGFYVLPVLYGDRIIARCEFVLERKTATLVLQNWWWEAGVSPDEAMLAALWVSLAEFLGYSGMKTLRLGDGLAGDKVLASLAARVDRRG